jgi:hypothetical protein
MSQVFTWVGIVVGVVFEVAVIFFSGFFLGWSSGSRYGWHRVITAAVTVPAR